MKIYSVVTSFDTGDIIPVKKDPRLIYPGFLRTVLSHKNHKVYCFLSQRIVQNTTTTFLNYCQMN